MVCEGLFIFGVKRACSGEHDGGVQVSDDARDRAGSCDTGLGAFVTCLEGGQHHGHLKERTPDYLEYETGTDVWKMSQRNFRIC